MMTMLPILDSMVLIGVVIGAVVLGLIIWGVLWAAKKERERKEALAQWASSHGYTFLPNDDHSSHHRFLFFDALNNGSNQYFELQIKGEYEGLPFLIFEYHYETYSTDKDGHRQTHHHHVRGCIIETGLNFPTELKLRPEGFFDKVSAMVGFDDIDFESAEFSKRFHVKSADRKFAYDIIHQGMMEYLLQHPKTTFEIERNAIMVLAKGNDVEAYKEVLRHTRHILELTPDYFIDQAEG